MVETHFSSWSLSGLLMDSPLTRSTSSSPPIKPSAKSVRTKSRSFSRNATSLLRRQIMGLEAVSGMILGPTARNSNCPIFPSDWQARRLNGDTMDVESMRLVKLRKFTKCRVNGVDSFRVVHRLDVYFD